MKGEFAGAWRLQSTIVNALMRREMQARSSQTRLGVLVNILEPVVMVMTIVELRYFFSGGAAIYGVPLALFVTTGYMPWYFWRMAMSTMAGAARSKTPTLMFPQVTAFDAVIARGLDCFITYSTATFISFALVVVIWKTRLPSNVLLVLTSTILALWFGAAIGVLIGVAARFYPVVMMVVSPLMRLSLFFSGALYLATEVPPAILPYLTWNPLFHAIEMMREAWLEGYESPIEDPAFAVISCVVLTALAMWVERATRRFKFS